MSSTTSGTEASIPRASREMVYVRKVRAFDADSPDAATDPTTLDVQVGLSVDSKTEPATWLDAGWVPDSYDPAAGTADVRYLLDPTALELAVRRWILWVHIVGAIEEPKRPVGPLPIT